MKNIYLAVIILVGFIVLLVTNPPITAHSQNNTTSGSQPIVTETKTLDSAIMRAKEDIETNKKVLKKEITRAQEINKKATNYSRKIDKKLVTVNESLIKVNDSTAVEDAVTDDKNDKKRSFWDKVFGRNK